MLHTAIGQRQSRHCRRRQRPQQTCTEWGRVSPHGLRKAAVLDVAGRRHACQVCCYTEPNSPQAEHWIIYVAGILLLYVVCWLFGKAIVVVGGLIVV